MSVILCKEANGNFTLDDNGKITPVVKFEKDKKGVKVAVLPENSLGKKYYNLGKMLENDWEEVDLTETRVKISTSVTKTPKLSWIDFIDDEDKEAFEAIKTKAEAKMKKAELMAQIEAQKKLLEELMAKAEVEA